MKRKGASAEDEWFFTALIGDGRPLVTLTGVALVLAGAFAIFISATGAFLPHDVDYLGMAPRQLCAVNQCRIVHFMFHDRVSFGGVIIAIGILYLWLTEFPLKRGEEWAWWVLAVSGATGFSSFLCYLGYGYLDTWHGASTLALLPCFIVGMWKSWSLLPTPRAGFRAALVPFAPLSWRTRRGFGRICLLLTGCGMAGAGSVIMTVGMTSVFVPQDLRYIGLTVKALHAINPRLAPLIAHDRAGFGGGLLSCGLMIAMIVWITPIRPALWQALFIAGSVGFSCALGIHVLISYMDISHVAPAVMGAALFIVGISCAGDSGQAEVEEQGAGNPKPLRSR